MSEHRYYYPKGWWIRLEADGKPRWKDHWRYLRTLHSALLRSAERHPEVMVFFGMNPEREYPASHGRTILIFKRGNHTLAVTRRV